MEDRRAFLRAALFGFAGAGLAASIRPAEAAALPIRTPGEPPWWLLAPLRPGDELGLGWSVARLFPPTDGAVTAHLVKGDRLVRVDLSLREGAPRGPAGSTYIDFIVMDGGDGGAPMDESLGRALRRLAAIVAENEGRGVDELAALLPHADRVWRHPEALARASTTPDPA